MNPLDDVLAVRAKVDDLWSRRSVVIALMAIADNDRARRALSAERDELDAAIATANDERAVAVEAYVAWLRAPGGLK